MTYTPPAMHYLGHTLESRVDELTNTLKVRCQRCDYTQDVPTQAIHDGQTGDYTKLDPCPNCPTCRGENRETVGLVCQTCGTDYGTPDQAPPSPDDLTEAERLGVLVAGCVQEAQDERDRARSTAVALEHEVAQARLHLIAILAVLERAGGTTFAHDTGAVNAASEWLDA